MSGMSVCPVSRRFPAYLPDWAGGAISAATGSPATERSKQMSETKRRRRTAAERAADPKPQGRKPTYTGETKQAIMDVVVAELRTGRPLRAICRDDFMPSWTRVYDWMEEDADFASRVALARDLGYEALAEETIDIADDVMARGEHVQKAKLRIETRLKLLACWNPKKYGNKATVDVGNKEGETLKVDHGVDKVALVAKLADAVRNKAAEPE